MENLCKNCGQPVLTPFCGYCGEKVYDNDRSIIKLFNEAFHFLTHFEGKFFTTLRSILKTPGRISYDYCNGARKQYFKPVSFFLLLVILYLLFPLFEGLNMHLKFHMTHSSYGESATQKVNAILRERQVSLVEFTEIYRQKSEKVSKAMLFLLLPAMAVVSYLLAWRKRKFFYDHFIFSVESNCFYILWGYLISPLFYLVIASITESFIPKSEMIAGLIIVTVYLVWLFIASKRFFKLSNLYSILYSLLYVLGLVLFTQFVYKFLLFNITIRLV